MPFIGKDWRSPGEAWVKTEALGWQRMKLIESQLTAPSAINNAACSWPPNTDMGHHMDINLAHIVQGTSGYSSSPSSSDSHRSNSISPSSNRSLETTVDYQHRLLPLAISSPYGSYSMSPKKSQVVDQLRESTAQCSCASNTALKNPPITENVQNPQTRSKKAQEYLTNAATYHNRKLLTRYKDSSFDESKGRTGSQATRRHSFVQDEIFKLEADESRTKCDKRKQETGTIKLTTTTDKATVSNIKAKPKNKLITESSAAQMNKLRTRKELDKSSSTCACRSKETNQSHLGDQICQSTGLTTQRTAPYCPISIRTREVAMYNTISEAFYRLDFCNAVHDIRRFNYICKLLHLLITQNLTSLSGCATKILFNMLEQIAREVSSNKRNIHVLKDLINELREMIQKYSCWGRPIGSSQLWQQHSDTIDRISRMVEEIELSPSPPEMQKISFSELPAEMVREILLRLNDYRDLISSAQASPVMRAMIDSQYIWERLCKYHFTEEQVKIILASYKQTPADRRPASKYLSPALLEAKQINHDRKTTNNGRTGATKANTEPKDCDDKSNDGLQFKKVVNCEKTRNIQVGSGMLTSTVTDQKPNQRGETSTHVKQTRVIFEGKQNKLVIESPHEVNSNKINHRSKRLCDSNKRFKPNDEGNKENGLGVENKDTTPKIDDANLGSTSKVAMNCSQKLDWEDVFHQLRKRFDLKEEYPDCLLLCRHCRCLFWKSIGHPCVQGPTDMSSPRSATIPENQPDLSREDMPRTANTNRNNQNSNGRRPSSSSNNLQLERRVSVAALSRNFDIRLRNEFNNPPINGQPMNPLNRPNRHSQESSNANGNGRNRNNIASRPSRRREELVPKHVAISPQAFLKFFSL